ncbi:cytochrome C [Ekhidna sp.]|uniref:cytochrome C n=1 Tax=Ekhidna sp. TaxID=2608089 RepID=UPI0032EC28AB
MDNRQYHRILRQVVIILNAAIFSMILLLVLVMDMGYDLLKKEFYTDRTVTSERVEAPEIVNGVHVQTGLVEGEGLDLVIQNCTSCHSSKLITQNRMTKTGWQSTIQWMQKTQNLWDLGDQEAPIINYLAANYAPQKKGRRARLENIEWYELE